MNKVKFLKTLALCALTASWMVQAHATDTNDARLITEENQISQLDDAFDLDCDHGQPILNIVASTLRKTPMIYVTGDVALKLMKSDLNPKWNPFVVTEKKMLSTAYEKYFVIGNRSLCVEDILKDEHSEFELAHCLLVLNSNVSLDHFEVQCQQRQQQQQRQQTPHVLPVPPTQP